MTKNQVKKLRFILRDSGDLKTRVSSSSTGCSLGLRISSLFVRSIAPKEHASIKVQSEFMKGSNFTFVLRNHASDRKISNHSFHKNSNDSFSMSIFGAQTVN